MYNIDVQINTAAPNIPPEKTIKAWALAAITEFMPAADLVVRFVDTDEITELNKTFRHKPKPTNVLSFPTELPAGVVIEPPPLGDIVICVEVAADEAVNSNISLEAHIAHLVIHGCLHLLGFDHHTESDATKMAAKEAEILAKLGL